MDFVERWFAISPDGGSGVFEACLMLAVIIAGCVVVFRDKLQTALYRHASKIAWTK